MRHVVSCGPYAIFKSMVRIIVTSAIAAAALLGCAGPRPNIVHQTSTIDALMSGVFDGHLPCKSLLADGDLGIGTFDHLDGEMIVLDGKVYRARADGHVYPAERGATTPYATVCKFKTDRTLRIQSPTNYAGLMKALDSAAPEQNLFCALRIHGTFPYMRTRSVPAQQKPYPPLTVIAANQPEFCLTNTHGTLVGFRCPAFVKGVNVRGYHLHFISDDRTRGGHVLAFTVAQAECQMALCDKFVMDLPSSSEAFMQADLDKDRTAELKNVESPKQ